MEEVDSKAHEILNKLAEITKNCIDSYAMSSCNDKKLLSSARAVMKPTIETAISKILNALEAHHITTSLDCNKEQSNDFSRDLEICVNEIRNEFEEVFKALEVRFTQKSTPDERAKMCQDFKVITDDKLECLKDSWASFISAFQWYKVTDLTTIATEVRSSVDNVLKIADRIQTSKSSTAKAQALPVNDRSNVNSFARQPFTRKYKQILIARQELPAFKKFPEIMDLLQKHGVVVVKGSPSCGISTQLPAMIIQYLGERLNDYRNTGIYTHARQDATRRAAYRAAMEQTVVLGTQISYRHRFEGQDSKNSRLLYTTDRTLLLFARSDPTFSEYKFICIDEAHEMNTPTILLLTVLNYAVSKRKANDPLYVVIMSANIEGINWAKAITGAKTYDIQTSRYQVLRPQKELPTMPLITDTTADVVDLALDLVLEIHKGSKGGDILVIMSNVSRIKELVRELENAELKEGHFARASKNATSKAYQPQTHGKLQVYPLYGRTFGTVRDGAMMELNPKQPYGDIPFVNRSSYQRKVVVATNIAETCPTIDGLVYVIDTGHVNLPTYLVESGAVEYTTRSISSAMQDQRAGIVGRTREGYYFRTFRNERPPMVLEPAIVRERFTDYLAELYALEIRDFFKTAVFKPSRRLVENAVKELQSIDVLNEERSLSAYGHKILQYSCAIREAHFIEKCRANGCGEDGVKIVSIFNAEKLFYEGSKLTREKKMEIETNRRLHLYDTLGDHFTYLKTFNFYETLLEKDYEAIASAHGLNTDELDKAEMICEQLTRTMSDGRRILRLSSGSHQVKEIALLRSLLDAYRDRIARYDIVNKCYVKLSEWHLPNVDKLEFHRDSAFGRQEAAAESCEEAFVTPRLVVYGKLIKLQDVFQMLQTTDLTRVSGHLADPDPPLRKESSAMSGSHS